MAHQLMVLHQGSLRLSIPRSPGSGRLRSEPERKGGAGRYQREESAARVAFEGSAMRLAVPPSALRWGHGDGLVLRGPYDIHPRAPS